MFFIVVGLLFYAFWACFCKKKPGEEEDEEDQIGLHKAQIVPANQSESNSVNNSNSILDSESSELEKKRKEEEEAKKEKPPPMRFVRSKRKKKIEISVKKAISEASETEL